MKWSKLKKRVEETFACSIRKRIKIYTTSYRKQDDLSRSWIVIDGKQKISLSDIASWREQQAYFHELTPTDCLTHKAVENSSRSEGNLYESGEFSSYDFKIMAFIYLNTSAHDCIKSTHPILRGLGALNKRIGIKKIKLLLNDPHPMVAFLANYRYQRELAQK